MMVKLGDILFQQPKSKIKAGEGLEKGTYRFFTSSNIQTKYIDTYQYDRPALIFGTGGSASVHYCKEKFATSTDCLVFYAYEEYLLRTIYYYLSGNIEILEKGFKGAGLKHISKQYILDIDFLVPPLEKQRKIVDTLDKVNDLIAKRKQQFEKFDLLVKSRFIEMFGDPVYNTKHWDIVLLSSIFNISSSKRIYQNELVDSGIPFFRISDIIKKIHAEKCTPELFISVEKYDELKKRTLVPKPGDILITSRGTLGECYVISDNDKFYFQDGMISWLYNMSDKANVIYITELFKLSSFRKQIEIIPSGSTVNYLSIARLRQLNIMLPPIELQNRFSEFVKQTEKTKTIINQSLEKLETLKKALMQEYFG